ncbi:MAG: MFS transporter [Gammaproteobacteria bacterium]|nr:MAG: MFS transporter [Gammaproteobacteria bacterium]
MTTTEIKTACLLAGIYMTRMLGLFLIFPTFSLLANNLQGSTPFKIGLALGIYSLSQAVLQIPAGMLSDIIGRKKVLYGGLTFFFIGSVLAANTRDIDVLIIARLLQGMGAVSAVCLAYVADSISADQRSKAMVIIGLAIGSSFILSFILGSLIADAWGLGGLFATTACLAAMAIVFAYLLPTPKQTLAVFNWSDLIKGAMNWQLLQVNLQVAVLHMMLSASFFLIPILLKAGELADNSLMSLYVPAILIAFVAIGPIIRTSRESSATRLPVFWAVFALALLLFSLADAFVDSWWFIAVLALFFFAFTFIEAVLPARLFQLAKTTSRGTTSGIFSVYQYGGSFLGGLLGAKLYTTLSQNAILSDAFYFLAMLTTVVAIATFIIQKKG